MSRSAGQSEAVLGFFTVSEHAQLGLIGGLLILNASGRPLEFHCTAPLRPNRAQQILYGPTLQPYLYGEQIGQALIAKATAETTAVLTDVPAGLAVRDHIQLPVALVLPETSSAEDSASAAVSDSRGLQYRVDLAHAATPELVCFARGRNRLAVSPGHRGDQAQLADALQSVAESFDFAEPFERIREAIEEAQRGGK